MISASFFSFLVSEIIQDSVSKNINAERSLHHTGVCVGMRLLELLRFSREIDLSGLLYKITYILLPQIYETDRKVECLRDKENTFVITEKAPLVSTHISQPEMCSGFCADSLIAGIIEIAVCATGYKGVVTAYTEIAEDASVKAVYLIEVKSSKVTFDSW